MSFNLVDLVKDYIGDQVAQQLVSAIGSDSTQTTSALRGAIPGLLSSFLSKGESGKSADTLFNVINTQDDSLLDNLGDMFGSANSVTMANSGSSMLSSLLGTSAISSLTNAISGFSGLGRGSSSSLLGLLAPIVMGVIKRKLLSSGNLNAGGLMDMLKEQKSNIIAAMPADFEHIFDTAKHETPTKDAAHETVKPSHRKRSLLSRLLPLLLLLLAGYFIYQFFNNKDANKAQTTPPSAQSAEMVPANTVTEPANIANELRTALTSVASSLENINSVESAQTALPKLNLAADNIGNMASVMNQLPESAKAPVIKLITSSVPHLQVLINKVNQVPGVGEVVNPSIQKLADKLALFK